MRLRLILLSIIFETIPVSPQKIDLNLSIDLQTFKKHGFPDRRQLDNRREFCNGICSSLKFCHREAKNFERKSIVKLDCNSAQRSDRFIEWPTFSRRLKVSGIPEELLKILIQNNF